MFSCEPFLYSKFSIYKRSKFFGGEWKNVNWDKKGLAMEIFNKIIDLNPKLMKNFSLWQTKVRPKDTIVKAHKSATFGDTSLTRITTKT